MMVRDTGEMISTEGEENKRKEIVKEERGSLAEKRKHIDDAAQQAQRNKDTRTDEDQAEMREEDEDEDK